MGGTIRAENVPGQGARFHLSLPLVPTEPSEDLLSTASRDVPTDFTDLLVLLVEDDAASRYVATRLVESFGCQVVAAADGGEALDRLRAGRFDLVLMDCQLPIVDGLEVTRRFRDSEPAGQRTPIVALTAYAFETDRERMFEAGMDEHLSKPVSRAMLEGLLRRYVG